MAMTLDLIGGSCYVSPCSTAVLQHTYVNITNHDADVNLGLFARLTPSQKRFWFHRGHRVYLWPLYGLLAIKWNTRLFERGWPRISVGCNGWGWRARSAECLRGEGLPSAWYRFRASISTRAPGQLAVAFGECDRTIRLPRADSAAPDRVPIFERGATRRLSDAFPSSNPQNQPKPRPEVTERGGA
jgi:hypothetical protein